jgi:DNA-binding NarL/FixJ family response regulator
MGFRIEAKKVRIIIADDHPVVRSGLHAELASEPGFEVVGEAATGDQVIPLCSRHQPDVLLLDLSMPQLRPMEILAELRSECPQVRVIVLTAHDDEVYIRGLVSAGVAAYLLKTEAVDALVTAVRTVVQGGTWFSRTVMDKLARGQSGDGTYVLDTLTQREVELLKHLARGKSNSEIAEELHLAEQTVRNYVSRIYAKMGVTTRAEAIIWVRERKLMEI